MYHNGQIVHDLDKNEPVMVGDPNGPSDFAWTNRPKRTAHYIENVGMQSHPEGTMITLNGERYYKVGYKPTEQYRICLPDSIEHAKHMLRRNIIAPSPCPPDHYWRCRNWLSNHYVGACTCTAEERAEDNSPAPSASP